MLQVDLLVWFLFEICSSSFQNSGLHLQQAKVFTISELADRKIFNQFLEKIVKLFYSNYWETPSVTDVAHYFHYNSHIIDFHYYCKMQLYCLKIYLAMLLCNMIPCLFQLNFIFFLTACFSSLPSFSFSAPSKRTQNSFTTLRHILDVLFILIFISIVTYAEAVVRT